MTENQTRVPAGVPTGGQFAASEKGESGVALADQAAEKPVRPRGWKVFARPQGSFKPWIGQIDLTDITRAPAGLDPDEAEDHIEEHLDDISTKIAERLRIFPPADENDERYDPEFVDIAEEFENADDPESLDWALQSFYDWGDANRFIMKWRDN